MHISSEQRRLLVLCAIRVADASPDWSVLAREAPRDHGIDRLYRAEFADRSEASRETRKLLRVGLRNLDAANARVDHELSWRRALAPGWSPSWTTTTPRTFASWPPPFLFMLGTGLDEVDLKAVAIVGTHDATEDGTRMAAAMAQALVQRNVTVVSGLAKGIDRAAHEAALDAGGRTIAVVGTGITRTYPSEHFELARRIALTGTVVLVEYPSHDHRRSVPKLGRGRDLGATKPWEWSPAR